MVVLILNCIVAPRGACDLIALRARRMQLEARLKRLNTENAELETRVQKLRCDDVYLKRLIREEFGFARPDELIYRFGDEAPAGGR